MKEKKRFNSIRVSMILMVLALITSCIVGGTYAKYISTGTGGDQSRIAKFGVVIDGRGTAFSKEYDSEQARGIMKSVLSTDNVIAPGTSGEMIAMSVSGNPEVSVAVTYKGEFTIYNWEVVEQDQEEAIFYCPLVISVNDRDIAGRDYDNAEDFQNAVNQAIADCSETYYVDAFSPNGLNETIRVPSVKWRWEFDGNNDKYDTYLGNRACEHVEGGPNDKIATVSLMITTTITQVD